ncbi:toll/interleukin-1 receptor domain-containing protein [Micromonospora sp. NPDC004551]|uniref:toll/interleukin-1 receptor domain-containing protein n=1 Tax=Micromonospora sp. NPDC004551 TaxID=3154284 RepID=UPI0033A60E86
MGTASLLGTRFSSGVFVSHTSRERSKSELRPDDTLNRHRYRKRYLGHLLDQLPERFAARQLDVWIDRREVAAGDQFEQAVCLSLIRCSVAVVLVDEDALTSAYMQEEARLLGWRKMLEPDLPIIPVLLGNVSALDFANSPLGSAGGLAGLSVLTPTNRKMNQAAAHQTATEICDQVGLVPLPAGAVRWVNDVAHFISAAPGHALEEAARTLGIRLDTLQGHREKHALVAAALLNSSLPVAYQVIRTIAEYLPSESLTSAKRRLVPLWVDLDDARALMGVSEAPSPRRIVHLIAGRLLPAQHAVLRASASPDSVQMAQLSGVAGEDMAGELVARYDDRLRTSMHFHPDDGPEDVERYLRAENTVAFALIRCDQIPARVVKEVVLELMRRFPGIVFALVSAQPAAEPGVIRGRRIHLAGDDQSDRQNWRLIQRIRALSTELADADVD